VNVEAAELVDRLGDPELTVLDVRSEAEYDGSGGAGCDPRQGHIPGARHLELGLLAQCETVERVREVVGLPAGAEIVAYCHSGSRSALAVQILSAAGYEARNYVGSWHEWSRRDELPIEIDGGSPAPAEGVTMKDQ
jgi:thiosulfate/3-mercaptopyruvate sulfurtransferase